MTIEEKLEHFREVTLETATREAYNELNTYQQGLDRMYEEHRRDAQKRREHQIRVETTENRQISNKELAKEQMACKRELSRCEEELTEQLYREVESILQKVKGTPEYALRLKKQVEAALAYAEGAPMVILLDPSDEALLPELAALMTDGSAEVKLSEEAFGGGTRAEIPSLNIRIDNSFQQKFEDIREEFRLSHVL